jgi:inosine-uridine nucleoside N-ribohydrolase
MMPVMPKRPAILLDCDPGHDDAIALLVAARHTDLVGVTTVSGNVDLDRTTRNALVTLQLAGVDVPVHAGSPRPLVAPPIHAEDIHGETGLAGPELPSLHREPAGRDGILFLIDAVRAHPGCWLVATGPLTNVALALRAAPDLAQVLAGISVMGGSTGPGNTTPAAEFNIYADPEAADIVFRSGVRLVMAGLDLTHQFMIEPDTIARIRAGGGPVAAFAADLMDFFTQAYGRRAGGPPCGPLHDPCAVLALTHPELFASEPMHVSIELTGEHTRGMTLADQRNHRVKAAPNVEVLTSIHADAAIEILIDTLASYRTAGEEGTWSSSST